MVGETGNMQMSKVWIENCTVDARGPVGGLIGNGLSPSVEINDCVVKDITLNVRYLEEHEYYAAPLVGHVVGGRAWRCAVIGKYNTSYDNPATNFFINSVSCPFVGKCEASGEFYVYDSYVTHGRFAKNTGPYNPYVKYDKDVAICGKTIDIINANGEAVQLTLTPDDMKTLVMAGVLGRLWIYAEGRYPMSYAYADEDDPADLYHSDGDMPAHDETGILHTIYNDGTHRYFDLQGRQLDGKPGKGIYIDNLKKYISK